MVILTGLLFFYPVQIKVSHGHLLLLMAFPGVTTQVYDIVPGAFKEFLFGNLEKGHKTGH